ncbi:MAG TPA: cyclase family protein [Bauldia sp.]|nr:cyclase family protein [Bauldia sp.]
MAKRWRVRPEHSNWGDFGEDDQIGRLNLITPERRRKAAEEIREGLAFCLSLPLDLPGGNLLVPERLPPARTIAPMPAGHYFVNFPMAAQNDHWTDFVCDDAVTIYTQYSTQWDALSHIAEAFDADQDGKDEIVYYNGYRAGSDIVGPDDSGAPGAKKLGIEHMAETCVQGRGVMVDLHAHFGSRRKFVGYDDLMRIMDEDNVAVEAGDVLCLHTGWSHAVAEMKGKPDAPTLHDAYAVLDGADEHLLHWIDTSGVAALVADNFAVEGMQHHGHTHNFAALPIHRRCIVELGIHLGELWHLTPLNKWLKEHGRSRFFLTAPPLRLPGSFGSPLTPVATV